MKQKAFTLIELLVVIVIIGILATISTATFRGTIEQAENAKLIAELSDAIKRSKARRIEFESGNINESELLAGEFGELEIIDTTINLAREIEQKTLRQITGRGCSECTCRNHSFASTPLSTAAQRCVDRWDEIINSLKDISNGIDLTYLRTDPWGSPYLYDENEGESSGNPCRADVIKSAGADRYYISADDRLHNASFFLEQCK